MLMSIVFTQLDMIVICYFSLLLVTKTVFILSYFLITMLSYFSSFFAFSTEQIVGC